MSWINAAFSSQILEKALPMFRLQDLKWAKAWYYTTISVSDLTWEVEGTPPYTIGSGNISLKQNNFDMITWVENDDVECGLDSMFSGGEITFINRASGTTGWLLWKYGAVPTIEVKVPANTPATTYRWVITYTLYDRIDSVS